MKHLEADPPAIYTGPSARGQSAGTALSNAAGATSTECAAPYSQRGDWNDTHVQSGVPRRRRGHAEHPDNDPQHRAVWGRRTHRGRHHHGPVHAHQHRFWTINDDARSDGSQHGNDGIRNELSHRNCDFWAARVRHLHVGRGSDCLRNSSGSSRTARRHRRPAGERGEFGRAGPRHGNRLDRRPAGGGDRRLHPEIHSDPRADRNPGDVRISQHLALGSDPGRRGRKAGPRCQLAAKLRPDNRQPLEDSSASFCSSQPSSSASLSSW